MTLLQTSDVVLPPGEAHFCLASQFKPAVVLLHAQVGTPDLYVEIVEDEYYARSTKKEGTDLVWNEALTLWIPRTSQQDALSNIIITVWDEDTLSDDIFGRVSIPFPDISSETVDTKEAALKKGGVLTYKVAVNPIPESAAGMHVECPAELVPMT